MKDGTSKIDSVAAVVAQLSREVSPGTDQFGNPTGTLFDGLQTLLAESRARDFTIHALQASINTLFAAISERLPSATTNAALSKFPGEHSLSVRSPEGLDLATEAVETLFDRQRQEQEQVLRAVAAGV